MKSGVERDFAMPGCLVVSMSARAQGRTVPPAGAGACSRSGLFAVLLRGDPTLRPTPVPHLAITPWDSHCSYRLLRPGSTRPKYPKITGVPTVTEFELCHRALNRPRRRSFRIRQKAAVMSRPEAPGVPEPALPVPGCALASAGPAAALFRSPPLALC